MIARLRTIALAVAVAGCDERALERPVVDAGPPRATLDPPAPHALGAVTRIAKRADVPLEGPLVDAEPGDWMLRSDDTVAVVSSARGRIVDLARTGGRDDLYYVDACAFDAIDRLHTNVRSMAAEGSVLHVVRRAQERPIALHTWIWIEGPGLLGIASQAAWDDDAARLAAPEPSADRGMKPRGVLALSLGELVAWGNSPTWVDGLGFVEKGGAYGGDFIARERPAASFALARREGRLLARVDGPDPPGFHDSARTGELVASLAPGGVGARRDVTLVVSSGSLGDAVTALPRFAAHARVALPKRRPAGAAVELARCKPPEPVATKPDAGPPKEPDEKPSLRFALDVSRADVAVPDGCWEARLVAPGHAAGKWLPAAELATSPDAAPRAGTLKWRVREGSVLVPAKLVVRGVAPTKDPSWGEDPHEGAALNAVYSLGEGERPLPPGKYRVLIHRGPEYTAVARDVVIALERTVELDATIERVVDTRGWISADLHVHAAPSFDAPTPLTERVRSLVAVDVEVAAATDHNRVTDYAPAIRELDQTGRLASLVGEEITTKDALFGHYNAFPLDPAGPPIPYESVTPSEAFAAARAAGGALVPGTPSPSARLVPIVQVNHPRMSDIGLLTILRFDRDDAAAWVKRAPLFDASFDALEVFNGDHYAEVDKVEKVLADWYALLDAGLRKTATGNSDSHKAVYQEAGVPRSWVMVPDDDPARFDPKAFVDAIRAGRVVVSSGPFVTIEAAGQPIGSTITAGDVEVAVHVDAPPWIDVAKVELVQRGRVVETWPVTGSARPRFEKTVRRTLAPGDWILAVVRGERPMEWLHRQGAKPFAFTNPIFVR